MNTAADSSPSRPFQKLAFKVVAGLLALLVVLVLVVVLFPWDVLRGPLNRYVTERTGRTFEITERLDIRPGFTTTVIAEGISFANPAWARDPYLLKARSGEFDIRLWPLLSGRIELPRVSLKQPEIGMELAKDGRRTWALDKQSADPAKVPDIGALTVDQGVLKYLAPAQGADINVTFKLAAESSTPLPLSFEARGIYREQRFAAKGRSGGLLQFSENVAGTFPIEVAATAGNTKLVVNGTVTQLSQLGSIRASVNLQGQNLEDLYKLLGVLMPATPPYRLEGQLTKNANAWRIEDLKGVLGKSDVAGELAFERIPGGVPMLRGKIASRRLDLGDLGPSIGMAGKGKAQAPQATANRPNRGGRVLPDTKLNFSLLKAMNADVAFSAAQIQNSPSWPINSVRTQIQLKEGSLQLEPLTIGIAGGDLSGLLSIDGRATPAAIVVRMDARNLQLNRLFPTIEQTKSSLGKLSGNIKMEGAGASTAQVLASSKGEMSLLMGQGRISNILMEFLGLDGGEVIKFLVRGDREIRLRCAAAAFDVKQGLMQSRVIVLDTEDTVIRGSGQISLADETLDLILKPEPKDGSILSARAPLKIGGTMGKPTAGPEITSLAGRAGLAIALAAINPLLALAATIETGPGEDANCAEVLKRAATATASGGKADKPAR
jgi:uncharacterized protein involved in outer membrane biogenesis